jgi:hypothetical protein
MSNLLSPHNDYICASTFEVLTSVINAYLTGFPQTSINKTHNKIAQRNLLPEQRWEMVINQLKRCIRSRLGKMCKKGYLTLEAAIEHLNKYATNISNQKALYNTFFTLPGASGVTITLDPKSKTYQVELKKARDAIKIPVGRDDLELLKEEVLYMNTVKSTISHVGAIYSVMKLCMILEKLQELGIKPARVLVCYANNGAQIKYGNLLKMPSYSDATLARQLFLIAKSVSTLYNGGHIFTVYIEHNEHYRFLVDTNNNLYTPIYYNPIKIQLNKLIQVQKAPIEQCEVKGSGSNNRKFDHPDHTIMHYTSNGRVYLFRCDEYFGEDVHEKLQRLNLMFSLNNNGRCISNRKLASNSSNYSNRCCNTPNNMIYQYIDLFNDRQKQMLYRYIYDDNHHPKNSFSMKDLGIYYLLIDLKHRMSNRFFAYPTTHNGDEDQNRTNGMKFNENTLKTNLRHIFCMIYGTSNKKMLRSSTGNTTGIIANMNVLNPIRVDVYGLYPANYVP